MILDPFENFPGSKVNEISEIPEVMDKKEKRNVVPNAKLRAF